MPKQIPSYVFVGNQGIGPNAISPHASWAKEDICDALQLATGPTLCVFVQDRFVAAINADIVLVRFGFRHAYPVVKQSDNRDVQRMGKIALRYWQGKIDGAGLEKAQIHYQNKYGRRFETPDYCAAWRLLSEQPHTVGTAPLLAGLEIYRKDRAVLVDNLKASVRSLLD